MQHLIYNKPDHIFGVGDNENTFLVTIDIHDIWQYTKCIVESPVNLTLMIFKLIFA